MPRYTQIHMLTPYPPSNVNRDDLGRPKTAIFGGAQRLRISSQALKRAWRTSDRFKEALDGHVGLRTRTYGRVILERMTKGGIDEKKAVEWTRAIVGCLGKNTRDGVDTEQLAHISPSEQKAILALVDKVIERKKAPEGDELDFLQKPPKAVDIALFGRMLAASPSKNVEAAAQVAHAITVHPVTVEDDFFTAVDDLNKGRDETGSGHMGDLEFGSGLFYHYININRDVLVENLGGDGQLADKALRALVDTVTKVSPTGKQNSFAHGSRATYVLVEVGDHQPRSLAAAFFKPVTSTDLVTAAVQRLEDTVERIDRAYGDSADIRVKMDALRGEGSLQEILQTLQG